MFLENNIPQLYGTLTIELSGLEACGILKPSSSSIKAALLNKWFTTLQCCILHVISGFKICVPVILFYRLFCGTRTVLLPLIKFSSHWLKSYSFGIDPFVKHVC